MTFRPPLPKSKAPAGSAKSANTPYRRPGNTDAAHPKGATLRNVLDDGDDDEETEEADIERERMRCYGNEGEEEEEEDTEED